MSTDRRRPLSDLDTETQTLGCRAANPGHCKNHSIENKCAFARRDNVCHLVPRSWKKLYEELSKELLLAP